MNFICSELIPTTLLLKKEKEEKIGQWESGITFCLFVSALSTRITFSYKVLNKHVDKDEYKDTYMHVCVWLRGTYIRLVHNNILVYQLEIVP